MPIDTADENADATPDAIEENEVDMSVGQADSAAFGFATADAIVDMDVDAADAAPENAVFMAEPNLFAIVGFATFEMSEKPFATFAQCSGDGAADRNDAGQAGCHAAEQDERRADRRRDRNELDDRLLRGLVQGHEPVREFLDLPASIVTVGAIALPIAIPAVSSDPSSVR